MRDGLFRTVLVVLHAAALSLFIVVLAAGLQYYKLPLSSRPHSEMHASLKPGGTWSHGLGIAGSMMILLLFLYSVRKKRGFGLRWGSVGRWLNVHIFFGIAGPLFVTLHSAFKFNGIVSVSYFSMMTVMLSGVFGRYIYMQIPRDKKGTALTLDEIRRRDEEIAGALENIHGLPEDVLARISNVSEHRTPRPRVRDPLDRGRGRSRPHDPVSAGEAPALPPEQRKEPPSPRDPRDRRARPGESDSQTPDRVFQFDGAGVSSVARGAPSVRVRDGGDHVRPHRRDGRFRIPLDLLMDLSLRPKNIRRSAGLRWVETVFAAGLFAAPISFFAPDARAQISPGKLSKSHSFLEGMSNCTKCHEMGAGPSVEKCLSCHREIALSLDNRRGYHHRSVNVGKKPCFECHSEHAGVEFDLVHWPDGIKGFRHAESGYDLEGKHRTLDCRSCHKPEFIKEDLKKYQSEIDLEKTFLGLHKECGSCHADEHRGQLEGDCLACHVQDAWVPARGFDHQRSKFPLAGKHRDVACGRCHPTVNEASAADPKDRSFVKYAGVASASCGTCHKDVHAGRFGKSCDTCHRTTGWAELDLKGFDHERTRFALTGRHREVACAKCHPALDPAGGVRLEETTVLELRGDRPPLVLGLSQGHPRGKVRSRLRDVSPDERLDADRFGELRSQPNGISRSRAATRGRGARSVTDRISRKRNPSIRSVSTVTRIFTGASSRSGRAAAIVRIVTRRTGSSRRCLRSPTTAGRGFRSPMRTLAQPCIACHAPGADDGGKLYRRYGFDDLSMRGMSRRPPRGPVRAAPLRRRACEVVPPGHTVAGPGVRSRPGFGVSARRRPSQRRMSENVTWHSITTGKRTVRYRPIDTACKSCHPIENLVAVDPSRRGCE